MTYLPWTISTYTCPACRISPVALLSVTLFISCTFFSSLIEVPLFFLFFITFYLYNSEAGDPH